MKVSFKTENSRSLFNLFVDFSLGLFTKFKTERHIVVNGHVRIKRVVLENHRDISILGLNVVHKFAVDIKFTVGNFFQTRDHTKSGGLTAAGRTDEYDKFFIFDIEGEIGNRYNARLIYLIDILQS